MLTTKESSALAKGASKKTVSSHECKLPRGPASRLWWGWKQLPNAVHILNDPLSFFTKLGNRYGDVSTFVMGAFRGYLINNPRLVKDFLTNEHQDFEKAEWQMGPMREVTGEGLLSSSGDLWKRQRRLIQAAFRRDAFPEYGRLSVETTKQCIQGWGDSTELNLTDEMGRLTMMTSIRNNLGVEPGPVSAKLAEAVLEITNDLKIDMESIISLPKWMRRKALDRKEKNLHLLNSFINNLIEDRKKDKIQNPFNVLDRLLSAVDEDGNGLGMSPSLARDEAKTMMIAGNHSVGATLSWTLTMLTRHRDVFQKVEQEVLNHLGDRSAVVSDLPHLPYLKQVVDETLRLYPSAWILFCRQAIRNSAIGNYKIVKGSWVFIIPFVTQRDERFFPEPLKFDPDRFSPERIGDIPQHAYFPFGNGPHVCVGKMLALTQIPLMLATIIQNYEIEGINTNQEIRIERDLAIRPVGGSPVRVTKRAKVAELVAT